CSADTGSEPDSSSAAALSTKDATHLVDAVGADPNAHADPFFQAFPRVGTLFLSNGMPAPLPYVGFDVDFVGIVGPVCSEAAEKAARGSGFVPVRTSINGQDRAFARVTVIRYRDQTLASYSEADFAYDLVPESAAGAPQVPWVNAYSAFVPSALPIMREII